MITYLLRLHAQLVAAGVPIAGVDRNGLVSPTSLQAAAQATINAFDDSPAAEAAFANTTARGSAVSAVDTDKAALWKAIRAAAAVLVDEINAVLASVPRPITSITRATTTATATTPTAHGMSTGQSIALFGADVANYNGVKTITVTGATTFTYPVANSGATPATGTFLYALNSAAPPLVRTLTQAKAAIQAKITAGVVD